MDDKTGLKAKAGTKMWSKALTEYGIERRMGDLAKPAGKVCPARKECQKAKRSLYRSAFQGFMCSGSVQDDFFVTDSASRLEADQIHAGAALSAVQICAVPGQSMRTGGFYATEQCVDQLTF